MRLVLGLKPQRPLLGCQRVPSQGNLATHFAAGLLVLPPTSVVIPKGEPLHPTRAPSPPEDPPQVKREL